MKPQRLLVTGGAGFIGANFVHYWLAARPDTRVVVLDALTYAGNLDNLSGILGDERLRFVEGDICDEPLVTELLGSERIDTIVHFAAETHVDRSIVGPDAFLRTNVLGTHSLLKAARAAWAVDGGFVPHRFHHVSTDEVYGSLGFSDAPFREDSPYRPSSPYAASKAASDHLVRAYHRTYGLDVTISNCSNNYGPYQYPEKLLPLMIVNALEGRPLPVYGDGSNVRDWLYVTDHCEGIALILERGRAGETYNIGGRAEMNNRDLVALLCAEIDAAFAADPDLARRFPRCPAAGGEPSASLVRFVPDRPGHDLRYAIDCSRITSLLSFRPRHGLRDGLKACLAWYLSNEDWWRRLMDARYGEWIAKQYGNNDRPGATG